MSSGGPTTQEITAAFEDATRVRLAGTELMRVVQTLPELEKQDILRPLFCDIRPGPGYLALAALAARWKVVVLNLNWDRAAAAAAAESGVLQACFDIQDDPSGWPDITSGPAGLYDVHLHGIIGDSSRFGTLETLSFSADAETFLVEQGLAHTTACIGASLNNENDLPQVFRRRVQSGDPTRLSSQHWYFVRGSEGIFAEDRVRQAITHGSLFTYVKGPDIDFDAVATLMADSALATVKETLP
jgi:hypothetical protein